MNHPHLVFQAYGHVHILMECKYALFSLSKVVKNSKLTPTITVYTDHPSFFEDVADSTELNINTRILLPDTLNKWRGAQGFVHRVKVEMLLDFTQSHEGLIFYCDTDVVFIQPLDLLFDSIASGNFIMHTLEGIVQKSSNPTHKKLNSFLAQNKSTAERFLEGFYNREIPMWNAGVLGFNSAHRTLLYEVLNITDALYKVYNRHIAEQFAFSYVMSGHSQIIGCDAYIRHYWNFKEFRPVLEHFFSKYSTKEAFLYMDLINPLKLEIPKRRYESMPWWIRAIYKLNGKWKMPEFELP